MTTAPQRLYFLDWLRIAAFFLLIFYHTGMYYVSWDWHVKSPAAGSAIEPLMLLSSPWRMSLLFLISGVASGCMLRKLSGARFLRQRSWRLLLPLAFGMLVIVPPQTYLEVVEKLGYAGSYTDFMRLYLGAYPGFCREDCLDLPTWNHLWFVAYLWCYSVLLWCAVATLGAGRIARVSARCADLLTGWRAVLVPVTYLVLARLLLKPYFEETNALVDDWYNHSVYLPVFLLGVVLAAQRGFWAELARLRFATLGVALAAWAVLVCLHSLPGPAYDRAGFAAVAAVVRSLQQWCAILAVCGFAQRHLNVDNAGRRYLTQAVFPVYIVHQTLIVVLASAMKPLALPPVTEGLVLVVLTFTLSFGIFEAVRRVAFLRPLFGIGAEERRAAYGTIHDNQAPAMARMG